MIWSKIVDNGAMSQPNPDDTLRLSVLDQSPIPAGSTVGDALRNSVDLAQRTEAMGYHRYWVAEHHNSTGLAGAAPEILIGQIASATNTIRVGSGGVMLSHYSSLKVAETFKTLAALHPGRIDVGVGRAPGSDQVTMYALAAGSEPQSVDAYPNQLRDLDGWLHDELSPDSPFAGRVRALPASEAEAPELWVLASSAGSASFAAHFGLPLSFADFIAVGDGHRICEAYREQYQPSQRHPEPRISVGASAICAETNEEAERLAGSVRLWRQQGLSGPIPTLEDVANIDPNPLSVRPGRKPMIVGDPQTCREQLRELATSYGAEELIVVSIVWDHEARVRSYQLIMDAF